MSELNVLTFRLVPLRGTITQATQANPTGFNGKSFYYEIIQGGQDTASNGNPSPRGQGRVLGIIVYDYFQSRWAVLFTIGDAVVPAQLETTTYYKSAAQQISDFLTAIQSAPYPQPTNQDAIGDTYPYPASFPKIRS